MEFFKHLKTIIETGLNEQLTDEEARLRPFCIYEDVGDFDFSERNINDIIGKKYGVLSLIGSNVSPLTTLKFAEITAQCEIVVNVDEMEMDPDDPTCMRYAPVAEMRREIESFIATYHGVSRYVTDTEKNETYSVTPTFTFAASGTYTVTTSNLGKIVPLRFTVNCVFVQNGVSSDSVRYTVNYAGTDYDLYAIDASENMIGTTEGQTHNGDIKTSNTVQEAKYGIELSMPLTSNPFCERLLDILHNGTDNTDYPLTVSYVMGENTVKSYTHNVIIMSVSLSAKKPLNVGLNISFIEADQTISVIYNT